MMEKEIIYQMILIEKEACQLVEKSKERANKQLVQTRKESKQLFQDMKKALFQDREKLSQRMQEETENKIDRIINDKKRSIEAIGKKAKQKRKSALNQVRDFLFNDCLKAE